MAKLRQTIFAAVLQDRVSMICNEKQQLYLSNSFVELNPVVNRFACPLRYKSCFVWAKLDGAVGIKAIFWNATTMPPLLTSVSLALPQCTSRDALCAGTLRPLLQGCQGEDEASWCTHANACTVAVAGYVVAVVVVVGRRRCHRCCRDEREDEKRFAVQS